MSSKCFLFVAILTLSFFNGKAQERCGTVAYTEKMKLLQKIPQDDQKFENWLLQKLSKRKNKNQRTQSGPYKVPVVVHVIHNGEPVGTGTNISDAQILSQIKVLNADYRRTNADASSTPALFQPLAGSMDIEFILAKQDPEGLPSNGIVRVQGSQNGWTSNDNYALKSLSYWPSEDYINIWVCDLIDDLVGYAQLPESDLAGLENSSNNAQTDGLVIWYRGFGSIDDGAFDLSANFSKGRTTTHEMGHYFGLRHIWGDDSGACGNAGDYVNDTPDQGTSSSGCPTHPKVSCGSTNMFQNFLDYTNDACMNLFTKGQVERMSTVIEASPRRATLLDSHGLNDPISVANDLGIRSIIIPSEFQCDNSVQPVIDVRNYGTNQITSASVKLTVNNVAIETKNFTLSLSYPQTTQLTFSAVNLVQGNNKIDFQIMSVNGVADGNSLNNAQTRDVSLAANIATPFAESFNTFPTGWRIENPDGLVTWQIASAPKDTPSNKALMLNLFDYEESYGEVDVLYSPVFDLSATNVASLIFDVSYARYASSTDILRVVVIKDCQSLAEGESVYTKQGSQLRTTNSVSGSFTPTGESDWRKEFVNLSDFAGESHVQLAFVAVSDWGNNIYLDNVSVLTSQLEDVALKSLDSPGLVTCDPAVPLVIKVQNAGTETINTLTVEYSVNGGNLQPAQVININATTGEEFQIELTDDQSLTEGENTISITLKDPNGKTDQTTWNNAATFKVILDETSAKIPLRENFNAGRGGWITVNPTDGMEWLTAETNFGTSMYFNAYSNSVVGDQAWLISPVLDFSSATEASIVFDVSHTSRLARQESLRILASKDCGNTFEEITDVDLNSASNDNTWSPADPEDWQQNRVVDLSSLAGNAEVRVAFVATNENGNNLFIDNIEFFTAAIPNLIQIEDQYSIYGYNFDQPEMSDLSITFNLAERKDVLFTVVDVMGKTQAEGLLTDVLNQTYPLEEDQKLSAGVYIVRLKIGNEIHASRILVTR